MSSNILFLDFDGPLFSSRALLLPENNPILNKQMLQKINLASNFSHWRADPVAIAFLNNLYQLTAYDIVVSSSWADDVNENSQQSIVQLLEENGLMAQLHPQWRLNKENMNWDRLYHIKDWIERFKPRNTSS